MKLLVEFTIVALTSWVLSLVLIPALRHLALRVKWVDLPNARKVHTVPIPLVGGIGIFLALAAALLLSRSFWSEVSGALPAMGLSTVMLLIGMLDDKFDLPAMYRLIIQLCCAYALAALGIRIVSLHGVFGIYELPAIAQYVVTIIVVTGVVNAFNLMDGIDGLAAGLAILGCATFAVIAYLVGQYALLMLFGGLVGGLIGFLKFNLGKSKVFLGDGGSLMLGFLLAATAIMLLQAIPQGFMAQNPFALWLIAGIFFTPVLDALRVFARRMRDGYSPMHADRSHLHHLVLMLGLNHKQSALGIHLMTILLLTMSVALAQWIPMTLTFLAVMIVFRIMSRILLWQKNYREWEVKLKEMERE